MIPHMARWLPRHFIEIIVKYDFVVHTKILQSVIGIVVCPYFNMRWLTNGPGTNLVQGKSKPNRRQNETDSYIR
jgi:hypothetical protein